MKILVPFIAVLFLLACSRNAKDQLIGSWEFEKLEVSDKEFQLADSLKEMRKEMERANRGLIFSFKKNGEITTLRRMGNSETTISTMTYEHREKDVLIFTDPVDKTSATINIHLLSNTSLRLSFAPNLYDIMVFRKIKR